MTLVLTEADWLAGRVPADVSSALRETLAEVARSPVPQPLALLTGDGAVAAANLALLDLLRTCRDDLLGSPWDEVVPGCMERLRAAAAAPLPCHVMGGRLVCGDEARDVLVAAEPLLTRDGAGTTVLAGWVVRLQPLD